MPGPSIKHTKITEDDIIHLSQGGHSHDGKDSSKVDLVNGQVELKHLAGDTIRYLLNEKLRMYPMPFVLSGALAVSQSPPFSPMESIIIGGLLVNLGTAGSADTELSLIIGGIAATFSNFKAVVLDTSGATAPVSLKMPSTATQIIFTFDPLAVGPYGTIAIAITTAGASAADFCGHVYLGTNVNGSA